MNVYNCSVLAVFIPAHSPTNVLKPHWHVVVGFPGFRFCIPLENDFRKSSSRGLSKGVSKGAVPGAPVLDDGTAAVFLQQKLARKEELVVGLPLVV